jgi:hypothetical protein
VKKKIIVTRYLIDIEKGRPSDCLRIYYSCELNGDCYDYADLIPKDNINASIKIAKSRSKLSFARSAWGLKGNDIKNTTWEDSRFKRFAKRFSDKLRYVNAKKV